MNEFFQNIWTALITPNENLTNILALTPLTFLDAYLNMLLFTTILNIKSSKRQKVIYVCSISFISIITRFIIPNPYGNFINMSCMLLLIFFVFKTTILKSIIALFLPLACSVLLESIFVKLSLTIYHISYEDIVNVPIYRLITMLPIYLCIYIIYRIVKYLKYNIYIIDNMDKKSKILFLVNFILTIILLASQLYLVTFYSENLPFFITLISILALIAYFTVTLYSLSRNTKLELTTRDLEESQLYNKTLTILHDNIRGFKHDFNNIVQAIGGYVQTDDLDGLKKYYSQLVEDCQKVSVLTVLNPAVINNPAVYSLLTSKYYDADAKGIDFNIDVFLDLNTLNMKIYEFTRILGILIDNAIEATNECDEKIINLSIRLDNKVARQLVIIENTYANKDIDTEKIFEKSYTTKPNNTGLGLWEVRKILKKNNNLNLYTTKDDKFFKQQLEVYL